MNWMLHIIFFYGICVKSSVKAQDSYKVICYFTPRAAYRTGEYQFTPENIDPYICTHILYGYAILDEKTLLIKSNDTTLDIQQGFYRNVTDLKKTKPDLKIFLALGGYDDSGGSKYSTLIGDPSARSTFIEDSIIYLDEFGFDGLHLEWLYPKCWQNKCSRGPDTDKINFSAFIKELSSRYKEVGFGVSASVSHSASIADRAYDIPILSQYLEFINVLTYEYYGFWDHKTGHISPLYQHYRSTKDKASTDYSIKHYIKKGANRTKLVLTIPTFGRSFTLLSEENNGLNAKTTRAPPGTATGLKGVLAYFEICKKIRNENWQLHNDVSGAFGPYATKGKDWVGFDDTSMARRKAEYALFHGLGGISIFSLDFDDFNNLCECSRFPITKTIYNLLAEVNVAPKECSLKLELKTKSRINCGKSLQKSLTLRINGGNIANPGDWPWIAAVMKKNETTKQECGGTLISDQHVLTAAHCFKTLKQNDVKIRLGEFDFLHEAESTTVDYDVANLVIHPSYNPAADDYDIAVLKLDRQVKFNSYIDQVCLPEIEHSFQDQQAYVIGNFDIGGRRKGDTCEWGLSGHSWGSSSRHGQSSSSLREVEISVWSQESCKEAYGEQITPGMMCAGGKEGGKDSCKGDSGGPLLTQIFPDKRWSIIGIVSWGSAACGNQIGKPGVYTRVRSFSQWIILQLDIM